MTVNFTLFLLLCSDTIQLNYTGAVTILEQILSVVLTTIQIFTNYVNYVLHVALPGQV